MSRLNAVLGVASVSRRCMRANTATGRLSQSVSQPVNQSISCLRVVGMNGSWPMVLMMRTRGLSAQSGRSEWMDGWTDGRLTADKEGDPTAAYLAWKLPLS